MSNSIDNISIYNWDEDYITRSMINDIRQLLSNHEVKTRDQRRTINWELYKLSGSHENIFGDICFLVDLTFKDGRTLAGAAFLEAKKKAYNSTRFDAMKHEQAARILEHAPRAQYLLYDHLSITDFVDTGLGLQDMEKYNWFDDFGPYTARTNATCCPMNLALASGLKDISLYRHSTPLSVMITRRYFEGLDLEFSEEALKIGSGFLAHKGLPRHIMKLDISEIQEENKTDAIAVNSNLYKPYED